MLGISHREADGPVESLERCFVCATVYYGNYSTFLSFEWENQPTMEIINLLDSSNFSNTIFIVTVFTATVSGVLECVYSSLLGCFFI